MVRNIPYFRTVDDNIINEILYMIKPKVYEAGSMIVHAGDEVNDVYLLKTGTITVEVPIPSYMNKSARRKLLKYQNFEYNMDSKKKVK
jgi:CRP-like cAMP-binding protein